MIEDDLSASPVRLRHEIRRLRALLPEGAAQHYTLYDKEFATDKSLVTRDLVRAKINDLLSIFPECEDDESAAALRAAGIGYFCGIIRSGAGCACPGSCYEAAKEVLSELQRDGYMIVRATT